MGYFSEMSLDMQEGRKPSAASLTRECAFEDGENFDELPVPPADRQPVPPAAEPAPQPAFEDDGDLDEAPEELEQPQVLGAKVAVAVLQKFIEHIVHLGVAPHVDHDLTPYPGIIQRKIARGTRNFRHEAAMTTEEADRAMDTGAQLVTACHERGCNVISIGEMGIGNTSPSSVWMHLLTGIPLEQCVGAGAGLNAAGIRRKYEILQECVDTFHAQHPGFRTDDWNTESCQEVLRWFGGFEMAAAVGAMLQAAELKMVLLIDGFIMTACLLMAARLCPAVREYSIFGHEGDEAGHRLLLRSLQAEGLLHLGLRLGEGTGAVCAYPLLQSAVGMLREMNDFDHAQITRYF